jgi:hypothetical protein
VSGKATDEDEATDKATEHKATERKAADKAAATDDDEGTATETHTRPEVDPTGPQDATASPSSNGSADAVPAGTAAGTSADSGTQLVDKAALLAATAFAVTRVELPSGRGVIEVRPLTRAEGLDAYGQQLDAATMEQFVLSKACVKPSFTRDEIKQWQNVSAAGQDILTVVQTVLHISGMDVGAGKDAYKRFRGTT